MHKLKGNRKSYTGERVVLRGRFLIGGLLASSACFLAASPAWAIPSPDLVISFFSNAAQFFGLLTVAAGGVVFFRQRDLKDGAGAASGSAGMSTGLRWTLKVLGLLLVLSIAANVLQWADQTDQRNRRLEANLVRSSTEEGRAVGDTSLKTLNFSDQMSHRSGMSSGDLAALLADSTKDISFIDLREPEEKEMGLVEGFTPVRFPDFLASAEEEGQKLGETVLICYSGNRSSEACEKINEAGGSCRFVVGGYEKWQAEGRAVSHPGGNESFELRALPEFSNKDRLLDTDEVRQLVDGESAIFIDVRYPGDFAREHLPGAINIPIRKLETPKILRRLEQIPKRPIVAPCYDKRSCFYSQILGLRLYRYGHDFRGRYSVPAEYFSLPVKPPHVESWLLDQKNSLLGLISRPIAGALEWLDGAVGHLALAIVILSIAMRLAMAPLTAKAERDRMVQERIAPDIKRLKAGLKGNPRRLSRAMMMLFKKHGLTPFRNMLGVAIQVPLFVIFFLVVEEVSARSADIVPWTGPIFQADPTYMLPGLFGLLAAVLLQLSWRKSGLIVWAIKIAVVGGLVFLAVNLNAGVNIYLVTGLAAMIAHTLLVAAWMERQESENILAGVQRKPRIEGRMVTLAEACRLTGAGGKAERLSQMMAAGLPVPKGFVVPHTVVQTDGDGATSFAPQHARTLDRLWRRMRLDRVAVRSSGLAEDSGDYSYAGVYESFLDIDRGELEEASGKVWSSLCEPAGKTYDADAPLGGGIIVQEMVTADYAGILFTEHPTECGSVLIEMAAKTTEGVTSGAIESKNYRFGRYTGQLLDKALPPIDLRPLIVLARRAEAMFGCPQDIEWAYRDGRFLLLQSRDITHLARHNSKPDSLIRVFEEERHRLLQLAPDSAVDVPVLVQNDLAELLPQPTPISLSLMQQLWAPGGSRDLACQALSIPYAVGEDAHPIVESVFGWLYVNAREEKACMSKGPGPVASFKLARSAEILEQNFREGFLPNYLYETRQREAIELSRLSTEELLDTIERSVDRFIQDVYVQADIINLAANFYLRLAEQELQRRGLSAPTHLGQTDETIVHRAMALLPDIQAGSLPASRFTDLFGHRAPIDYELAQPRYNEDSSLVDNLVKLAGATGANSPSRRKTLPAESRSSTLALSLDRAHKFQILKEEAKHHCLRDLSVIRRMLLELGKQMRLDDAIFYLTLEELPALRQPESVAGLRKLATKRQQKSEILQKLGAMPSQLSLIQLEALQRDGASERQDHGSAPLQGTIVAGDKAAVGRAHVIDDKQGLVDFADGDILVARYIPSELTPVLARAGAIVTELGGWLSHTSILARELNVTAVVGVKNATARIADGDMIEVQLSGEIRLFEEDQESEVVEFPDVATARKAGKTAGKQKTAGDSGAAAAQLGARFNKGLKR